ncbi:hypothetical protein [Paraburkholderia unamae]|uniref:Uncharacterized protein n=1 Tax=Paraburkholderia unamae TaxID=219649 RepID=A0ACC6RGW5_9BURK
MNFDTTEYLGVSTEDLVGMILTGEHGRFTSLELELAQRLFVVLCSEEESLDS